MRRATNGGSLGAKWCVAGNLFCREIKIVNIQCPNRIDHVYHDSDILRRAGQIKNNWWRCVHRCHKGSLGSLNASIQRTCKGSETVGVALRLGIVTYRMSDWV